MGHPLLHQPVTDREGDQGGVLGDHKEMEKIAPGRRLLHQPLVPQGEGVGVHHNGGLLFSGLLPNLLLQPRKVAGKAVPAVFQEGGQPLHTGNLRKAQVPEEGDLIALGVKEKMEHPLLCLMLHQAGDDMV